MPVHVMWQSEIAHAEPVEGTLLVVPSRSKTENWCRSCTQEVVPNETAELCAIRRLRTLYLWHRARFQQRPCGAMFISTREPYVRLRAKAAGARGTAVMGVRPCIAAGEDISKRDNNNIDIDDEDT